MGVAQGRGAAAHLFGIPQRLPAMHNTFFLQPPAVQAPRCYTATSWAGERSCCWHQGCMVSARLLDPVLCCPLVLEVKLSCWGLSSAATPSVVTLGCCGASHEQAAWLLSALPQHTFALSIASCVRRHRVSHCRLGPRPADSHGWPAAVWSGHRFCHACGASLHCRCAKAAW